MKINFFKRENSAVKNIIIRNEIIKRAFYGRYRRIFNDRRKNYCDEIRKIRDEVLSYRLNVKLEANIPLQKSRAPPIDPSYRRYAKTHSPPGWTDPLATTMQEGLGYFTIARNRMNLPGAIKADLCNKSYRGFKNGIGTYQLC